MDYVRIRSGARLRRTIGSAGRGDVLRLPVAHNDGNYNLRRFICDEGCEPIPGLMTQRILHLTQHLGTHRKDYSSRRGLLKGAASVGGLAALGGVGLGAGLTWMPTMLTTLRGSIATSMQRSERSASRLVSPAEVCE